MTIGIETRHPGVYIVEEQGAPRIIGVGVSAGGFLSIFRKGPTDEPQLITNKSQQRARFGSFYKRSYGPHAVERFFDEGGARCWVARVVGEGAAVAEVILKDMEGGDTLTIRAASVGSWGDDVQINTQRYATKTTAILTEGDTSIAVASINNIQLGDALVIADVPGGVSEIATVFVNDIDVALRTVSFQTSVFSGGVGTTIPSGANVECATSHRRSTFTVGAPIGPGATEVEVDDSLEIFVGARMTFDDDVNAITSVLVTAVSGNIVKFAAIATSLNSGAVAATQEFNITVFDEGLLLEEFTFLSMEPTNERDYVEDRLSGKENESTEIEVEDLSSTPVELAFRIPDPVPLTTLDGGDDGATPGDNDYIGQSGSPTVLPSGIEVFNQVDDINMLSIPGVTSVPVQKRLADYAMQRHRDADPLMVILDAPLSDDRPQEVREFREHELNVDAHQAALYYPWAIVADPVVNNQRLRLPLSGWVQGQYAQVALQRGVHHAPANIALTGIIDLTYNVTNGEQDILNPVGINAVRKFRGRGIRIWGARTLWQRTDGRHYVNIRRLLNFIEESIEEGNQWAVFELNDPILWRQIERVNGAFLTGLWQKKMLTPTTNVKQSYFVKCDEETNTPQSIAEGRVICEVGVNAPPPAEFVIFRVGLYDGRAQSIEEEIAQRA